MYNVIRSILYSYVDYLYFISAKVVIITDLGQRQNSAQNAENATNLPKTLHMPSLCFFHNLESQIAGLHICLLYVFFHNLESQIAGLQ